MYTQYSHKSTITVNHTEVWSQARSSKPVALAEMDQSSTNCNVSGLIPGGFWSHIRGSLDMTSSSASRINKAAQQNKQSYAGCRIFL